MDILLTSYKYTLICYLSQYIESVVVHYAHIPTIYLKQAIKLTPYR